jgi:hypothetical protein
MSLTISIEQNETVAQRSGYATDPPEPGGESIFKSPQWGRSSMESLSPKQVLVHARTSVNVHLPGIEINEKTFTQGSYTVSLHIIHGHLHARRPCCATLPRCVAPTPIRTGRLPRRLGCRWER